jgi:hypothetical protein
MSEWIEIDGSLYRTSGIISVTSDSHLGWEVNFEGGGSIYPDESYESIRDKLLGKHPKADLRAAFACQIVQHLRDKGLNEASVMVAAFYNSMMLSETEGAG